MATSFEFPYRLANGIGNWPDADKYMANWDFLLALLAGNYVANSGLESWTAATTFTNPASGAALADSWTMTKSGTSSPSVDVSREATIFDTGAFAMKLNITGAGSSDSKFVVKQSILTPLRFAGQTVVAGIRVRAGTAGKVFVKAYDGTTTTSSPAHTGGSTYELLQARLLVGAAPSEITISLEINPSDFTGAIYIDSVYLYAISTSMSTTAQALLPYIPFQASSDYLPKTGGTLSGSIGFDAPGVAGIIGSNGTSSATPGNVGQYVESLISSSTISVGSAGVYFDITSISLTAGDWEVTAIVEFIRNGATITSNDIEIAITQTIGNSITGMVNGSNHPVMNASFPTTFVTVFMVIPPLRVALTGTTTIYLKGYIDGYTGGPPKVNCRLSARRMR